MRYEVKVKVGFGNFRHALGTKVQHWYNLGTKVQR